MQSEYCSDIPFDLAKLLEPNVDRPIGDQFDVLEADDFAGSSRAELSVTRNNIHYLRRFETDSLRDGAAPTCFKRLREHARVRSRRARAEHKRVGELHA